MQNIIQTSDIKAVKQLIQRLHQSTPNSHKGQNGRLLVIGGSGLFHASVIWAAEIASKLVDMVHVSSPTEENNDLMRYRLKEKFWNGIVVPWNRVMDYVAEDDVILIGPGMQRVGVMNRESEVLSQNHENEAANIQSLEQINGIVGEFEDEDEREGMRTRLVTNYLLEQFPNKKWVIDGGALQEVNPKLLNGTMIITPHHREWERLLEKASSDWSLVLRDPELITQFSRTFNDVTVLLKGSTDQIVKGDVVTFVEGGNAGMTKGGTGDVLAGLVAALATDNDTYLAAQAGSVINKAAGDALFRRVGMNFNASELLQKIPEVIQLFL